MSRTRALVLALGVAAACDRSPPPTVAAPPAVPEAATEPAGPTVDPAQTRDEERRARLDRYPTTIPFDEERDRTGWYDAAFLLADRARLPAYFDEIGYRPPEGTLLLVTQILPGVDGPRYDYFAISDTPWDPAPGPFTPASTVKLMATMAALWTLYEHGLTGDAKLSFRDIDGKFYGTPVSLYKDAILHSSNQNYNRLMEIAGFDETNTRYLTPELGLPIMVIQSRYGPEHRGYGLRNSPKIYYREGEKKGVIEKRKGEWRHPSCRSNCVTIFELQDILRRVVLDAEIPESERFPVAPADIERVQDLLRIARNRLQPAPDTVFETEVDVYNSVGRIPGRVLLENSYLHAPKTGERIFLSLSLKFPRGDDPVRRLKVVARNALDAILRHRTASPGLQRPAGPPQTISLRRGPNEGAWLAHVQVHDADRVEVWFGRRLLGSAPLDEDGHALVEGDLAVTGDQLLVSVAYRGEQMVAYRYALVEIPEGGPSDAAER